MPASAPVVVIALWWRLRYTAEREPTQTALDQSPEQILLPSVSGGHDAVRPKNLLSGLPDLLGDDVRDSALNQFATPILRSFAEYMPTLVRRVDDQIPNVGGTPDWGGPPVP